MNLSKKRLWALFFAGVLVLLFFVMVRDDNPKKNPGHQDKKNDIKSNHTLPAVAVRVAPVERKDLIIPLNCYGQAVAERKVTLRAGVSGKIKTLQVEENMEVPKGVLLASLDAREFQLEVKRWEAERLKYLSEWMLDNTRPRTSPQKANERKTHLSVASNRQEDEQKKVGMSPENEKGKEGLGDERALIISGRMRDQVAAAKKNLTQAEVNLEKAWMDLKKTEIRAPFSGQITGIQVALSEYVPAGKDLFTLVDLSSVRIDARVLESHIGKVRKGQSVESYFPAYPETGFPGRVISVSPVVDPESRTCKVIIRVDNFQKRIKPGMQARVSIVSEVHPNTLVIPQESVLVRSGRTLVFVIQNDLAKWRYVTLGKENRGFVEILAGVEEGEKVIVENHFFLGHDTTVSIIRDDPIS